MTAPPGRVVQWHAATGDLDRAFDLLHTLRAATTCRRTSRSIRCSPPLRADARYAKLAERLTRNFEPLKLG